jgi:hypothetical protein
MRWTLAAAVNQDVLRETQGEGNIRSIMKISLVIVLLASFALAADPPPPDGPRSPAGLAAIKKYQLAKSKADAAYKQALAVALQDEKDDGTSGELGGSRFKTIRDEVDLGCSGQPGRSSRNTGFPFMGIGRRS